MRDDMHAAAPRYQPGSGCRFSPDEPWLRRVETAPENLCHAEPQKLQESREGRILLLQQEDAFSAALRMT
ncbi:MAG: hypothetical protein ACRELX_05360, partial [Longimicrobiales bacterium]